MPDQIQRLNPPELGDTSDYGFSQIVTVPAGCRLAFIAGQGGGQHSDVATADDFTTQLEDAFANLRRALTAIGATPNDVVKITILSVNHDREKLKLISAARKKMWPGENKPASTLIPVPRLASDGMLFEIDAVAVVANQPGAF